MGQPVSGSSGTPESQGPSKGSSLPAQSQGNAHYLATAQSALSKISDALPPQK